MGATLSGIDEQVPEETLEREGGLWKSFKFPILMRSRVLGECHGCPEDRIPASIV